MDTAILIVGLVLLVVAFLAGLWAGRRGGAWRNVAIGLAVATILVRGLFRYFPDVEYALVFSDFYASIRAWWAFPACLLFLGMAVLQTRRRWLRMTVEVLAGFMFIYFARVWIAGIGTDYRSLKSVPDPAGICLQSSDYSCGAAAAASLLALAGFNTTEREMAELCGTNAEFGTDEFAVCRGLRRFLAGRGCRVEIERSGWEQLERTQLPVMATTRLTFLIDHWVVIKKWSGDSVTVIDPLRGEVEIARPAFERKWRCDLVTLHCPGQ